MTFRNTSIIFVIILLGLVAFDWQTHIPTSIYWGLAIAYSLIVIWGSVALSFQFYGPVKCKGEPSSHSIALTFDDGPEPQSTSQVLGILKNSNAKATFFCIGKNVKDNPDLIRQIDNEGHLIGNHSFYHGSLFDLQPRKKW